MGKVADLVAKTLRGDDGDFIAYALVGLEVKSELWVVAFDDNFGRLLDGLSRSKESVWMLSKFSGDEPELSDIP